MGNSHSLYEEDMPTWSDAPNTATATRGPGRVCDVPTTYKPHMTLYTNLMERRLVDDGSRPIFGSRPIDPVTGEAGDYQWVTYAQFLDQVAVMSAAMVRALGLKRQEPVGIFSKNRYEWVLVEHGANRMAYQIVPLYDTLGPTAVPFIVNQTEMRVLFCAKDQLKTVLQCASECPQLKIVVQFEEPTPDQVAEASAKGIELKSLKDILEIGAKKPVEADPPLPEDIATICYTSGTTGTPKGAVLSHANLACAGKQAQVRVAVVPTDVVISYLPLPHVYERAVHICHIASGASIGFYQGDVAKLLDDFAALRPTVFPAVPRVLNRIHDKIVNSVEAAGGFKRSLFNKAFARKKAYVVHGYVTHAFWDRLVFRKAQQLLGGRLRIIGNGSAPITRDCREFLQVVFGCPVTEGYGLTETAAITCVSTPAFPLGLHVGGPVSDVQVCLVDVPEMNYTSLDKPAPRGEICVRGPTVFKGYFKDPEKTAEVMDADGWFHTGDIGMWNPDGTLAVIDRKKNIFKLSQGEYIAPEKIENIYAKASLVAQVFVHGDSLQDYVVGVVIPDREMALAWAKKQLGQTPTSEAEIKALMTSETLKVAIMEEMEASAVKYGLFRFERVRKIHLDTELWTVDQGLLTPTFKLRRQQAAQFYSKKIDEMYGVVAAARAV